MNLIIVFLQFYQSKHVAELHVQYEMFYKDDKGQRIPNL